MDRGDLESAFPGIWRACPRGLTWSRAGCRMKVVRCWEENEGRYQVCAGRLCLVRNLGDKRSEKCGEFRWYDWRFYLDLTPGRVYRSVGCWMQNWVAARLIDSGAGRCLTKLSQPAEEDNRYPLTFCHSNKSDSTSRCYEARDLTPQWPHNPSASPFARWPLQPGFHSLCCIS